jgi:hypothetical protein
MLFFAGGATERLRISSAGNVGIGTSTPNQLLEVSASASPTIRINNSNTAIAAANVSLGRLEMYTNDASANGIGVAAYIDAISAEAFVGNWTPTNLVFGTGSTTANATERLRIDSSGNIVQRQPAPAAIDTTATLTAANLRTRIITSTTAAAVTGTLPTGTLMDGLYSAAVDMGYDWSVINTGANTFTVAAGADHTVVGNMDVVAGTSGAFRSRRTAATTWVTYRVG